MNQVQKFLIKAYLGIGTTRSKRLAALAQSGEWARLQQERLSDPRVYQNASVYYRDALAVELFRKCLLPGSKTARYEAAVATFWSCESQCAATNARINPYIRSQGPFTGPSDLRVLEFIALWRKEICRVLGKLPLLLTPSFSGGSTLSDKGALTTIPDKMSSTPTVYARSYSIFRHSIRGTPLDDHSVHLLPRGNRFFTVPKDSEKDRGCCIEASSNVALQLAVGRLLKGRYRDAYKVDLAQMQPKHREFARTSSVDGSLATIDLSNASDTIAARLVELLLPSDWYMLLNSLRAPTTEVDGRVVYLSKFSSMGNGFTFELETILFRSLLTALGSEVGYTFGDDIIVETALAEDAVAALKFFGFTPNSKKTFLYGPFRESCGGDFFNGVPVRAHYMTELPDEPQKWIELANGLRRADPSLTYFGSAWWYCVEQVPADWRNFGPSSLVGVSVFHTVDPQPKLRKLSSGFVPHWRVKRPITRSFPLGQHWSPKVAMVAGALGVPSDVVPRDSVIGYKTDWVPAWGLTTTDIRWWGCKALLV